MVSVTLPVILLTWPSILILALCIPLHYRTKGQQINGIRSTDNKMAICGYLLGVFCVCCDPFLHQLKLFSILKFIIAEVVSLKYMYTVTVSTNKIHSSILAFVFFSCLKLNASRIILHWMLGLTYQHENSPKNQFTGKLDFIMWPSNINN